MSQRVKTVYLQTPTKIGPYSAITTIDPRTMTKASSMLRLEDGSVSVTIDDIIYIIPSANVKIVALEGQLEKTKK